MFEAPAVSTITEQLRKLDSISVDALGEQGRELKKLLRGIFEGLERIEREDARRAPAPMRTNT